MGKVFALVTIVILVSGCNRSAEDPELICFPKRSAPKPLTEVDRKAISDAMQRTLSSCRSADTRCDFTADSSTGEIVVHVGFATVFGDPPRCNQRMGGDVFFFYSPAGKYVRTVGGM